MKKSISLCFLLFVAVACVSQVDARTKELEEATLSVNEESYALEADNVRGAVGGRSLQGRYRGAYYPGDAYQYQIQKSNDFVFANDGLFATESNQYQKGTQVSYGKNSYQYQNQEVNTYVGANRGTVSKKANQYQNGKIVNHGGDAVLHQNQEANTYVGENRGTVSTRTSQYQEGEVVNRGGDAVIYQNQEANTYGGGSGGGTHHQNAKISNGK